MYELQILFQRRRRMLTRLALMLLLGAAATLAILPRADARVVIEPVANLSLLSPYPVAGSRFSALYPPHGTIQLVPAL